MNRKDFIYCLPLGTKERNALRELGVDTIEQLLGFDPRHVQSLSGYGRRTEERIRALQQLAGQAVDAPQPSRPAADPADENLLIQDIDMGSRERRVLELYNIRTLQDLRDFDPYRATQVRGIGSTTLKRIVDLQMIMQSQGTACLPKRSIAAKQVTQGATAVPPPDLSDGLPVVESLIRACVPRARNRDIYRQRLGIPSGFNAKRPVLQELASKFGVTRERIRQICQDTDARLRQPDALQYLSPFWDVVEHSLDCHNGFNFFVPLFAALQKEFGWQNSSLKTLSVLLQFHPDLIVDTEKGTVSRNQCRCLGCPAAYRFVAQLVGSGTEREQMPLSDASNALADYCRRQCPRKSSPGQPFNPRFIRHIVADVPDVDILGSQLVSHDFWLRNRSQRVRDLAFIVFKDAGEPLHFRALAEAIRTRFPRMQAINDNRVHGSLVRCKEFSCISRGTYGLASWGLKPYKSHGRAVIHLLERQRRPMRVQEIIQELTQDPDLNAVSIRAALHNHTRVKRVARATYALAEAGTAPAATGE